MLKEVGSAHWKPYYAPRHDAKQATNETGLTILPAGVGLYEEGHSPFRFSDLMEEAYFWSPDQNNYAIRVLHNIDSGIRRWDFGRLIVNYCSIRCVKD